MLGRSYSVVPVTPRRQPLSAGPRLSYQKGRGGSGLNDRTLGGREKTTEPITTPGSIDEQSSQPTELGGRWPPQGGGALGCYGRAVAKAAAAAAAIPARRRLPRAGAMVKLAAKCLLAGESGPSGPIRLAGFRGLERAPWGGARPAAGAALGRPAPLREEGAPERGRAGRRPGFSQPLVEGSPRRRRNGQRGDRRGVGTSAPSGRERWEWCLSLPTPYPLPPTTCGESRAVFREGVKRSRTSSNARTRSERRKGGEKKSISAVWKGGLRMGKVWREQGRQPSPVSYGRLLLCWRKNSRQKWGWFWEGDRRVES